MPKVDVEDKTPKCPECGEPMTEKNAHTGERKCNNEDCNHSRVVEDRIEVESLED